MSKVEKTLIIILALSIFMKVLPVPLANVLTTISAMPLAFLYFIFGFAIFTKIGFRNIFKRTAYAHLKPIDIIISILSGMALSTPVMSILFNVNYWPAGRIMAVSGIVNIVPFVVIALCCVFLTKNQYVYKEIMKRGIPLLIIVMALYVFPITTRLKVIKPVNIGIETEILQSPNKY